MRCLVTGGAGFIGSAVVRALLARGDAVRVLDDFSTGKRANLVDLAGSLEVIEASLESAIAAERALAGVDCVFHLAAKVSVPWSTQHPVADQSVNCGLTVQLLSQAVAAKVRRFVYSSSAAVYGDCPVLPLRESDAGVPMSPYGVSKFAGELYTRMYARCFGLEAVALRYFNVYGPRQDPSSGYSGVLSRFLAAAAAGDAPILFGDGRQTRDFVYVGDVAAANLLAASAPAAAISGHSYNIATGISMSLLDLLASIANLHPGLRRPAFQPARPGDIAHSAANVGRAERDLGFRARLGIAAGLQETLDWVRAQARPAV